MDCFVASLPCANASRLSQAMTAVGFSHTPPHSRGVKTPELCQQSPPKQDEGVGNAGRSIHPQSRVQNKKAHEVVTTGSPNQPGIPARNGFNGFLRDLPGDRAFLSPSFA